MKKLLMIVLVLLFFLGCQFRYKEAWDYTFDIPELGLETVRDVMLWVAKSISFHSFLAPSIVAF